MLYSILKPIIRFSLHTYFRKIEVIGYENFPKNGPVIFVANHPSAVIDPLIIAMIMKKSVFFLAGSEWFGKGLKSYIFKKELNMIPVHRPWLANGKTISNVDMFSDCYSVLESGNSIALFPEASSETVSKIREIKTGAVRIKTGYEDYCGYKQEVPVIPIGLNYSDPHQFRSNLLIVIGKPVNFEDHERAVKNKERVKEMTLQVENALKETIIHIEKEENTVLVKNISKLLIGSEIEDDQLTIKDKESNFHFAQNVAKALDYYEKHEPEASKKLSHRINSYFGKVVKTGISDNDVSQQLNKHLLYWSLCLFIIGFPVYIATSIVYFLPLKTTTYLFRQKVLQKVNREHNSSTLNPAFTGSMLFLIGLAIFMLYSILLGFGIGILTREWLLGLGIFIVFYPGFQFNMFYRNLKNDLLKKIKGMLIKRRDRINFSSLQKERSEIIEILMGYQNQFNTVENR